MLAQKAASVELGRVGLVSDPKAFRDSFARFSGDMLNGWIYFTTKIRFQSAGLEKGHQPPRPAHQRTWHAHAKRFGGESDCHRRCRTGHTVPGFWATLKCNGIFNCLKWDFQIDPNMGNPSHPIPGLAHATVIPYSRAYACNPHTLI